MPTDTPTPRRRRPTAQQPTEPTTAPEPVEPDDELDADSAAVLAAELPAEPRRRPVAAVPDDDEDDRDDDDDIRPATLGPVFGKRKRRAAEYKPFGLEITRDADDSTYVEQFAAHTEIDGGAVLQLMQARTQAAQGAAVMRLMGQTLRNNDGVPVEYMPPTDPAMDDDGYVLKDDDTGLPLYEDWEGYLTTDVQQLIPEHDAGSSRRRFAAVMDATHLRVTLEALTEIAQWLVKETAERPTRRPSLSGTGRRSTGTGSGAKRR